MPAEKVLICGAGVAGSILAFWLAKHDFQVVVVERSKAEQKAGQGLEIEEPALTVVRQMGILDKLKERRTGEMGFNLVDERSHSCALLEVGSSSPTGELELMRGDLTAILYNAANDMPNVTYYFETTVQGLRQTEDKVIVDLGTRNKTSIQPLEFDFVVGADGVKSRTRQLVMGPPQELDCLKPVGAFVAYFSIPKEEQDWPYSRLCHFPDRRVVWTRPTGENAETTSVALIYVNADVPSLRIANDTGDRRQQKEALAHLYHGLGWETPRVIDQMMKTDNFYSDTLMQVKLKKWSQHRVVLVGDAAWAPTPFTGQGNQLAIIGAWVLAQELSRDRSPTAFGMYEKRLRSYVEQCQNIPLGGYAPYIFCPKTFWGIWLLRIIFGFAAWLGRTLSRTGLSKYLPDLHGEHQRRQEEEFDLQVESSWSVIAGPTVNN